MVKPPAEGQLYLRFVKRQNSQTLNPRKRPQLLEKHIERAISDYFRILGLFFWKNDSVGIYDPTRKVFKKNKNPYRMNGTPDLIAVRKGRFIGFEIKTSKNVQTDSQIEFERICRLNGAHYFVLRSVDDAKEAIAQILKDIP